MTETLNPDLVFLHRIKVEGRYTCVKPLLEKPGRWSGVFQFAFTWAIIEGRLHDYDSYEDRWCFATRELALAAWKAWNGVNEPEGWHRHPTSGRRRPDGDASEEYVSM